MFKAKQVQTLDVDKIMQQIIENHDAKVTVDKLTEFLNREIETALASRNDDAEIKEDAKKGYDWIYRDIFYNVTISGEKLADLLGYKVRPEDQGTYEIIRDKYIQFKQEKESADNGE